MQDTATWFVVFRPREENLGPEAWWQRCLHAGYRHVFAFRADAGGTTLVNHNGADLVAKHILAPPEHYLRELIDNTAWWVLCVVVPRRPARAALRPPMTCVEAVKAALGINVWWVITPRQLARYLARRFRAVPVIPLTTPRMTEAV